jgi:hypothetical protein
MFIRLTIILPLKKGENKKACRLQMQTASPDAFHEKPILQRVPIARIGQKRGCFSPIK